MSWPALVAGLIAAAWCAVHLFIGGREVARPLRDAPLPEVVRATAWMTWHMTTASLATIAALLVAGWALNDASLIGAGALLAAAVSVAGILTAPVLGVGFRMLPQGWLFVPVAALAAWSALTL